LPPVAVTATLEELVTLPSSSARTAPFTTARDAKTPAAANPPALIWSTRAIASFWATTSTAFTPRMRCVSRSAPRKVRALFRSAVTVTAPLEVIEADGPTVATVFAPLVTSASAYAPESPTSETEPIVTCALARYSDVACTLADADAVIVPFMSAVV